MKEGAPKEFEVDRGAKIHGYQIRHVRSEIEEEAAYIARIDGESHPGGESAVKPGAGKDRNRRRRNRFKKRFPVNPVDAGIKFQYRPDIQSACLKRERDSNPAERRDGPAAK